MKKKLAVLLLSLCALIALSSTAFSASDEATSSIDVKVEQLEPGYYMCAVWDGDTLLCLFDYTVGSDGIMDTTVDIGEALPTGTQVKVGISSANAGGKQIAPIVCTARDSSSDKPTKPAEPANPSKPTESLYNIYIPNVTGGIVTTPNQSSYAGTYIPLIVTPSRGYILDYIFLTDTVGNRIPVSYSSGQYWFLMPSSNVTVHAAFVPTASVSTSSTPVTSTTTSRPIVTSVPETPPLTINVFTSKVGSVGRVSYSIDYALSATVTGGSGDYSYQFEIRQRGTLTRSTGWTSNPVFSGHISGNGTCIAEITVKDSDGKAASTTVDVLTGRTITPTEQVSAPLTQPTPTPSTSKPESGIVDGQSLSIGISSTKSASIIGSNYSVTFNLAANATGGSGGYSYRFEVLQNGKDTEATGWTSNNAISGALSGNGLCVVEITVRDASGKTASATVDLLKAT